MIVNPTNLQNLFIGFDTRFAEAYNKVPNVWYPQLSTEVPSTTTTNVYPFMTGLPTLREWVGERQINNLNAKNYTLENKQFEGTIAVGKNTIEDDQWGVYNFQVDALGEAAKKYPDYLMADLLTNGQSQACYDGQAFFDHEHPTEIAGQGRTVLQSNLHTSTPLTSDNISSVRSGMMAKVGNSGKVMGIVPNLLCVAPQNEMKARTILQAEIIAVSQGNGAAGQSNVLKGLVDLLVVPELANDPESWYLLDTSRSLKPFIFQNRQAAQLTSLTDLTSENVFMRKEFIFGVDMRCAAGYGLWFMAAKCTA